jgi:7-alpha-hydroxysteroid dehydrogenase
MSVLDKFSLEDQIAVVTGAGKGIGRGISLSLAEAGADLVIASRNQSDLKSLSLEIESLGRRALIIPTDVTIQEQLDHLASSAIQEFGSIDIWVNNAGGLPDATPRYMTKTSESEFDAQIGLNFKAVWSGCVIAAKNMKEKGGSIINISSATSKNMGPNPKNGPYGAAKSAVNSITASFSQELAPNIRVNAIAPGPVPTDNFNDSVGVHSEEETKALMSMMNIPLKRLGTPEDIGAAVVFMSSPASGWITGQCLFVDGGM